MKIAWIAPVKQKCGIAFYSKQYGQALESDVEIVACDPMEFIVDKKGFGKKISQCDCAHIQYETSLFTYNKSNFFKSMCKSIAIKKIITVHEIYETPPYVFPRKDITGMWPVKKVKEYIWDLRHPHWVLYAKHEKAAFYSNRIIVHAHFQKEILNKRGVSLDCVVIIPHPIPSFRKLHKEKGPGNGTLVLGATGFINISYDYDLLIETLMNVPCPWKFVWVGGPRKPDDEKVLLMLQKKLITNNLQDKFIITGWVDDEKREDLLSEIMVYCALFTNRSASGSLSDAIGSGKMIVATRIALTEELHKNARILDVIDNSPVAIAQRIIAISTDAELKKKQMANVQEYAQLTSYNACAKKTIELYRNVISS